MNGKWLLLAPFVFVIATDDARACSCMGPHLSFLSPMNVDDAPLNTHVRIESPSMGPQPTFVLRAHNGADVPVKMQTYPEPAITIVELVPNATLAASTRYEVATIDKSQHPPITVIGTFKTGTTEDKTAPRLDSIGKPRVRLNAHYGGGDCSIKGPWIDLEGVVAHDDRGDGYLAFGVWSAAVTAKPDTILFSYRGRVSIGQTSLCDPRRFTFTGSVVQLTVAALDDAGNASKAISFRADVTKPTP